MNFIGHATIALWRRSEPAYVLGSMLPDFASMARTRLAHDAGQVHELVADGIALHLRTDDVFHTAPVFTGLLQETLDALSARGVARGTARAVGHIGVEMLIDGELLHASEVGAAYLDALRAGRELAIGFRDAAGDARWQALRERLLSFGPPHDYRDPDTVLTRLTHVLSARPRLAIDAAAAPIVQAYLPHLQQQVRRELPRLLASLRAALA